MEQQLTNPLAQLGPARLARLDDVAAVRAEQVGDEPRLGRLARAVQTLEAHEHAGDANDEGFERRAPPLRPQERALDELGRVGPEPGFESSTTRITPRPARRIATATHPPARVVHPVFTPYVPGWVKSIRLWFTHSLASVGADQRVK